MHIGYTVRGVIREDDQGSGWCEDLFKERGLKPHRFSQDQQCPGTGTAGKEDG